MMKFCTKCKVETLESSRARAKLRRELFPEKIREATRKCRQLNLEISRERERIKSRSRTARKRQTSIVPFSLNDWKFLLESFNNHCAYCGNYSENLTMDHVWPLSKGGAHSLVNILPVCNTCNCSKHNKNLYDWAEDRFGELY